RLNGAIFRTSYDEMQLTYRLGIVPLLFNPGESKIEGAELEFTYAPGAFILEGSLGYLDNEFEEIAEVPGTTQTVGTDNRLPFTPEWQGTVGNGYDFAVGAGTRTPRVSVTTKDQKFFVDANTVELAQLSSITT